MPRNNVTPLTNAARICGNAGRVRYGLEMEAIREKLYLHRSDKLKSQLRKRVHEYFVKAPKKSLTADLKEKSALFSAHRGQRPDFESVR